MTDSFLDYLRFEKNYSEKTIVSYGIDLTKFEEYFKGKDEKVDFTTVDADLVRGWVMNLMENGYTSASVNRKLSSLRSFYRFLLKKGVIEEDPMLKIIGPKNKKPLPVFLKEREMDRLLGDEPDGEWIYICFCKPKTEFTPVVLSFPSKERCDRGGSDVENHWTEK